MLTTSLLAYVTPAAIKHAIRPLPTKSLDDQRKIQKLFGRSDQRLFESTNFTDVGIDITQFDWCKNGKDTNWWWQIQQLPFLNWHRGSYDLLTFEERENFSRLCLDSIFNWIQQAKKNTSSPMVWQDQASAFRLRILVNWLLFMQDRQDAVLNDIRVQLLGNVIVDHLDWLQDDKNYSKHTNHGFDQALSVTYVTVLFSCNEFEPYRQKHRKRLADEVSHAFTDEGVHVENSPAYQKYMLSQLRQLRNLAPLGERDLSTLGEKYITRAETFLRAITLPNGFLPLIGDTSGQDQGLVYSQGETIDVLDYSRSGYVIIRGKVLDRDFHLVFKASHLSHYHRHDDDLSIHIYFNGEVVLGDGGLGFYNESDPKRVSLRSYFAHNVPFIENTEPLRHINEPFLRPRVFLGNKKIFGESRTYGVLLKRELCFSDLASGKIVIKDYAAPPYKKISTNFYSPLGATIDSGCLRIGRGGVEISPKTIGIFKPHDTYFSERYNEITDNRCCIFSSEETCNEFVISFSEN